MILEILAGRERYRSLNDIGTQNSRFISFNIIIIGGGVRRFLESSNPERLPSIAGGLPVIIKAKHLCAAGGCCYSLGYQRTI